MTVVNYGVKTTRNVTAYHGSMFWNVENFGKKKWVVCVRIAVNWRELSEAGLSTDEIFQRCIAHLNLPPKRKKFQRRRKTPLYGKLSPVPVWTRFKDEDGQQYISALIVTDKRRCRQFWSERFHNLGDMGERQRIILLSAWSTSSGFARRLKVQDTAAYLMTL